MPSAAELLELLLAATCPGKGPAADRNTLLGIAETLGCDEDPKYTHTDQGVNMILCI